MNTSTKAVCVTCPYCSRPAVFRQGSGHIYGGRDFGPVWQCPGTCDAYVGCHPDGGPLGRLANKQLRLAKRAAHAAFDPLWQNWMLAYPEINLPTKHIKNAMHGRAYQWLSVHMSLPIDETHIGMFDEAQCAQAIAVIEREQPTSATVREWAKRMKTLSVTNTEIQPEAKTACQ